MDNEELVQKMLIKVKNIEGQKFIYNGNDSFYNGLQGEFEVLEDMNCCAPTQDVLFSFQSHNSRKVMSAHELEDFLKDCILLS